MRSSPPSWTRSAKPPRNTGARWWPSASAPSGRSTPTPATTLGIQLANLTRLVDPETVALGGGVTLAGDIFWDPLRATIEGSLAQDSIPLPRLVEAELHSDAGLHGAAIALLNHYEPAPA
jgi:hypothetical protein